MKHIFKRPGATAAVLITIYLLGLVLSVCTISIYPLVRQRSFLLLHAREIAQRQLDGKDMFELWLDGKTRIMVYDAGGNLLQDVSSSPEHPVCVRHDESLRDVLSGKESFRLVFEEPPGSFVHGLIGMAGVPIIKDGTVIGAAFYIRKIIAISESLAGYAVYYTLFFWVSAWFIVSSIHKKQKLEVMQQNYIANVTHALKTPIASIRMLAEALCDEVVTDPDKQKVYFGLILQETTNQTRMVQEILELSKAQSQNMDFSKSAVSAADLFQPVLENYSMLCDCTDVTLHVSDEVYQLPPLYTNAACIKQILQILLDNAIQFVPGGGNVFIRASVTNHQATICVRDDGIGISKESLPFIFDRFYKSSRGDGTRSSGLGLAIAQEIIHGLGEKIWAESELDKGSAFFFTIRLKEGPPKGAHALCSLFKPVRRKHIMS